MCIVSSRKAAQLREELVRQLERLKVNKQNVPLDVLKTRYEKSYSRLCDDIKNKTIEYFNAFVFSVIRVERDYFDEAADMVSKAISDSDIEKKLSKAVFSNQDITEFDALVGEFLDQVSEKLETFYAKYSNMYPTDNPDVWIVYCKANNSIKVCGRWFPLNIFIMKEDKSDESTEENCR